MQSEPQKDTSKQSYKDTIRLVEAVVREFKECIVESCPDEKAREVLMRDALSRLEKVLIGTPQKKGRKDS